MDGSDQSTATPSQLSKRGWLEIAKRTYTAANEDHIGLIAAGVAFYGFLALVPLLAALVLAYGLFVDPAGIAKTMHQVTVVVPADAAKLIDGQLETIEKTAASKKGLGLLLALLLSIYGAMKGAGAVVTALDVAYEVEDKRSFVRGTLLSAAITVGAVLVAVMGLLAASPPGLPSISRHAGHLWPPRLSSTHPGSLPPRSRAWPWRCSIATRPLVPPRAGCG